MGKIAYPLSLLIIRNTALYHQEQTDSSTDNKLQGLSFSGEFLNHLVKLVSNDVKFGEDSKEYKDDLSMMLSLSGVETNTNVQLTVGSSEVNSMSHEQLIQGIMENLQKDLEKCTSISLSMTTAATIAAAAVSQQREARHEESLLDHELSPDVIVFTCNHHFTKVYFIENILPEFQQRMSELLVPLANTTKTLIAHYKKSESNLLAACPVCVFNSLRSEQLEKASDSNVVIVNGFKAKPWDI